MSDEDIYPPLETLWANDWDDLVSLSEEAAAIAVIRAMQEAHDAE